MHVICRLPVRGVRWHCTEVLRDAKALHDKFFGAPAAPTVSCVCVCALGIYNQVPFICVLAGCYA